jgi:phage tail-like protein
MRGTVAGLATPYPIGTLLPAVYQEDPFAMGFTAGLDDVLATAIATIDCIDSYVDPMITPADFLEWLGGWVGAQMDENAPENRQRALVAASVDLHQRRGTVGGLRAHLELLTGGRVEVVDSGGTAWSATPNAELPGAASPRLAVRVVADDPAVTKGLVETAVAQSKPAHVKHRIEVMAQ